MSSLASSDEESQEPYTREEDVELGDQDLVPPPRIGTLIDGLDADADDSQEDDLFASELVEHKPKVQEGNKKATNYKPTDQFITRILLNIFLITILLLQAKSDSSESNSNTAKSRKTNHKNKASKGKREKQNVSTEGHSDEVVDVKPSGTDAEGSGDEYDEQDGLGQPPQRDSSRGQQGNIFIQCGKKTCWTLFEMLSSSWLNFFLAASPFTMLCWLFNWPAEAMFILSLVSFVGLSQLMVRIQSAPLFFLSLGANQIPFISQRVATDQLVIYAPRKIQTFTRLHWLVPFILAIVAMANGHTRLAQTVLLSPILFRLTITNGLTYFVSTLDLCILRAVADFGFCIAAWTRKKSKQDGNDGRNTKQAIAILLVVLFCIFLPSLLSASIGMSLIHVDWSTDSTYYFCCLQALPEVMQAFFACLAGMHCLCLLLECQFITSFHIERMSLRLNFGCL